MNFKEYKAMLENNKNRKPNCYELSTAIICFLTSILFFICMVGYQVSLYSFHNTPLIIYIMTSFFVNFLNRSTLIISLSSHLFFAGFIFFLIFGIVILKNHKKNYNKDKYIKPILIVSIILSWVFLAIFIFFCVAENIESTQRATGILLLGLLPFILNISNASINFIQMLKIKKIEKQEV